MKGICCVLLLLVLSFIFISCDNKTSTESMDYSNDYYNDYYNDYDNDYGNEDVNFDLSQYVEYGELSEGLIWVVRETEGSWDEESSVEFAYLDINGNVVYGWETIGDYFEYEDMYIRPQNFKNGYAYIIYGPPYKIFDDLTDEFKIINTSGDVIAEINVSSEEPSIGTGIEHNYSHFSENGYAYFFGYRNFSESYDSDMNKYDLDLFFIDSLGNIKKFDDETNSLSGDVVDEVKETGEYFYINYGQCNGLFDKTNGYLAVDFNNLLDGIVPDDVEIISSNEIEVYFTGDNLKDYKCTIDFDGNFIEEPQEW